MKNSKVFYVAWDELEGKYIINIKDGIIENAGIANHFGLSLALYVNKMLIKFNGESNGIDGQIYFETPRDAQDALDYLTNLKEVKYKRCIK